MPPSPVLGLLKFGTYNHIEQLIREGHLYMNPLSYFISGEADALRADAHEGTLVSMQPDKARLSVEVDGQFHEIPGICGPISYRTDAMLRVNVYCMFAVRPSRESELIDPRNIAFGDSYALLTDGDEFLRRVQRAAAAQSLTVTWRPVEYVERGTYHGKMGVFRKFSTFAYQSEFRIAMFPGTGTPFSLRVGDLSDIALMGASDSVNRRLRLSDRGDAQE